MGQMMPMPPMEDAKSVKIKVKYDKKGGGRKVPKDQPRSSKR